MGRTALILFLLMISFLSVSIPVVNLAISLVAGDTPIEPLLAVRNDVLFFGTFSALPWTSTWGLEWGPIGPPAELVTGQGAFSDCSYRVKYAAGGYGPQASGSSFKCNFNLMGMPERGYDSLYFRYYLKFEKGFEFVKGGKLPGLVGGAANTGGQKPTGLDGWSARVMWRDSGRIVQYLYHPDQPTQYGEDIDWDYGGVPHYFVLGQWHCVETYIRLNTPGFRDGVLRSWLDGDLACQRTNIRYRDIASIKIDSFYFSTFHGGDDPSWAPSTDVYCVFDNFVVAKNYIGSAFDFSLSNNGGISVCQGASGSNTITVTLTLGTTQTVTLSTSALPLGATASFNRISGGPTFASTCTISTSISTPAGSYAITVIGMGGGLTRTTSFALTVIALKLNQVSVAILNASKNTAYFVRTGNIYDDSVLGFIYSKCVNSQNIIIQTDSTKVNQTSGAPLFTGSSVLFGGRLASKTVKYYEDQFFAKITFSQNSTHYIFMKGSTPIYSVRTSSYNYAKEDYFVIQIYADGLRTIFSMWGMSHTGTYASGLYFADYICPNLASMTQGYYICKWTDLNNDGIQQSNEISQIASGS